MLHGDTAPGDHQQEREANAFAAEFLTPSASVRTQLPPRTDFTALIRLQRIWGVSVKSLLYRCRELGHISDSAASRAYQRLHALEASGALHQEPTTSFPGEAPSLLTQAFGLATNNGLTLTALANELSWHTSRVRTLLSQPDNRPQLRVVP
jgi:Zn-dependent peptidase ImmA (M78 family)